MVKFDVASSYYICKSLIQLKTMMIRDFNQWISVYVYLQFFATLFIFQIWNVYMCVSINLKTMINCGGQNFVGIIDGNFEFRHLEGDLFCFGFLLLFVFNSIY